MKRGWLLLLLAVAAAALFLAARSFTPDLVNFVVVNAFLQKAPAEISRAEARQIFAAAFEATGSNPGGRKDHLNLLFEISQRLEKVQRLSPGEAAEMLDRIRAAGR